MQDRVPLYPGRVVLTPVPGQANTYDMTRADQPTQEGTPLNKASLLKDATAALFGFANSAVPDDMLNALAHTGDLHVWKRTQNGQVDYPVSPNPNAYQEGSDAQPAGYTLGEVQSGNFSLCVGSRNDATASYKYGTTLIVSDDGSVDISGSDTVILSAIYGNAVTIAQQRFLGKYIKLTGKSNYATVSFAQGQVYFIPADATISGVGTDSPTVDQYQTVTGYPAIPANTTIEYVGQLGEPSAKIATGSYVGTGTYGQSNPTVFNFERSASLLMVWSDTSQANYVGIFTPAGGFVNSAYNSGSNRVNIFRVEVETESNDMVWNLYNSASGGDLQMNHNGFTYYYRAIC